MPARPGLPICQHIGLGEQLLTGRELLIDAADALSSTYPKESQQVLAAQSALKALDDLRDILDRVCSDEGPSDDWSRAIYYAADLETWQREVPTILERHRAGRPPCCTPQGPTDAELPLAKFKVTRAEDF